MSWMEQLAVFLACWRVVSRYFLPSALHFSAIDFAVISARLFGHLHCSHNMNLATLIRLRCSVKLAVGLRNSSNPMEAIVRVCKGTILRHRSPIHSVICFGSPIIWPKCGRKYSRLKSISVSLWWKTYCILGQELIVVQLCWMGKSSGKSSYYIEPVDNGHCWWRTRCGVS